MIKAQKVSEINIIFFTVLIFFLVHVEFFHDFHFDPSALNSIT